MAEKEYIEREAMVEIITMLKSEIDGKCMMDDETLLYFIRKMPAADVAPVVRCEDCKYLMFSDCYGECSRGYLGIVRPDCYCCYGEKKER